MRLLLALLLLLSAPCMAQGVSAAEARHLASALQNTQQRNKLISELNAIAATAPAKPKFNPQSIGETLLQRATLGINAASQRFFASMNQLAALPQVGHWARAMLRNPFARGRAFEVLGKLAAIVLIAALAAAIAWRGARRLLKKLVLLVPFDPLKQGMDDETLVKEEACPVDAIAAAEEGATEALPQHGRLWYMLRLLPIVLLRLLVDLIPVAAFAIVGYLLLGTILGEPQLVRLVSLATLSVIVATWVVWCVMRMLVSPDEPKLRLLAVSSSGARTLVRWTGWVSLVVVAGVAVSSAAGLLGLPTAGENAWRKLVSLILHLMLVAAVLRARKPLARRLRPPPGATGAFALLREWFARIWAYVAIAWIVALWFVWAVELQDGPIRLLQVGSASLLVLIANRLASILALGSIERWQRVSPETAARFPGIETRVRRYSFLLRVLVRLVLLAVSLFLLFDLWGWNMGSWLGVEHWGRGALSASITILVSLAVGIAIWEVVSFWLTRHIEHLVAIDDHDRLVRLRTIQPILRTTLLVILGLILCAIWLSEIGVDIGPLLAGAGIVGLAVGFGAQKMVQDFITGAFLLLDNAVQVGDSITAAGLSGTVEHLSLRCLNLRGTDGTLHFIPFSAVTAVSNSNRGRSVASLRFEFSPHVDMGHVADLLRGVGAAMHDDENFAPLLVDDLKVLGLEDMTGDRLVMLAQFPCRPGSRLTVSYEFRRLLLIELAKEGIALASSGPTVEVVNNLPEMRPLPAPANPAEGAEAAPA